MDQRLKLKAQSHFSRFPKKILRKGKVIIEAEETPDEVFYLKKGYVRAFSLSPQGVELTLHIFTPGSYFPMIFILNEIKNRYYFETLTEAEIYVIPKGKIISFLRKNPAVLEDLTSRLLRGLDKMMLRIEYLVYSSAKVRVNSTLMFLARHFGKKEGIMIKISLPVTHREIAAFAGISRETVSRELEKMQKDKTISYKKQFISIKYIDKLRDEN